MMSEFMPCWTAHSSPIQYKSAQKKRFNGTYVLRDARGPPIFSSSLMHTNSEILGAREVTVFPLVVHTIDVGQRIGCPLED
jgi:hypothetical protein